LTRLLLHVPVNNMSLANSEGITNFIAVSRSLDDLMLSLDVPRNHLGAGEEARNAPVLDRFLLAAALNGQLSKLSISNAFSALPLANCLHANRTTLERLLLSFGGDADGVVITPEMNAAANVVADAFGTLTSLDFICIDDQNDQRFVLPILSRLVDHPSLRILIVEGTRGEARDVNEERRAHAIKEILLSSTPLESFGFDVRNNDSYESAKVIFTGLHGQRANLSNLHLTDICPESDEGADVFADMLRHNTTVEALDVDLYSFVGFSTIVEAIGTNFDSSLQELHLCFSEMNDEAFLKDGCRRLATLLPRLRHLKTLSLCAHDYHFDNIHADLLHGLKLNKSLTSVHFDGLEDDDTISDIEFYIIRNKFTPFLASASKQQMLLVFETALEHDEAGLSVVFDALRLRDDWYRYESTGDNKAEYRKRQKLQ
jgi:hypothetical protein